jgi:dTDP-4-amino-4,6-dideoxygalactose transaminase
MAMLEQRGTIKDLDTIPAIHGGTMTRESFLPFGAPVIGEEEIEEVVATLRSGWIGTGPKCWRFESQIAEYVTAKHAITASSCTAALHLALIAAGIKKGDEVIVPSMTFAATANVVEHVGATPRFVDVDPDTLNMDPLALEAAITPATRAVIPVHFGGLPVDLDPISELCRDNNLILIEDAAHAIGAEYKGRMIGSFGDFTCFSFYPNKNMTTGEGGAVTTSREEFVETLKVMRLHGLSADAWRRFASKRLILSEAISPGFKYNMTDIQASLGIHQLRRLPEFLNRREEIADYYDGAISDSWGVRRQYRPDPKLGTRHALHLYVLVLDLNAFSVSRNEVVEALLAENIGAAIHYRALHMQPFYERTYGYELEDFPIAGEIGESILTIPCSPGMSNDDADTVVRGLKKVLNYYRR